MIGIRPTSEIIRQIWVRAAGRVVDLAARLNVVTLKRIVILGMLLRVVLLLVTSGSNDIRTWEKFGRNIAHWGVLDEYRRTAGLVPGMSPVGPPFNHPPLMGLWARTAVWISDHTFVPFRITFKVLPLAADLFGLWVIWSLARKGGGELRAWRAAAVFSTSLTSIVITGHHGNTDSACAVLVLVAAALIAEGRRPVVAGLAFAAALNVKLIPLVLLPGVALLLPDVRTMMRFITGLTLGLTPFMPPVMFAGQAFYANAIAYQPRSGWWGISLLLSTLFDLPVVGSSFRSIAAGYATGARYVMMAGSLGLGVWARRSKCSAVELAALVFAMFLFLTPAIGVQYLVILVPVLVMTDLRRAGTWGLVTGLFVCVLYIHFRHEWLPFSSVHNARRRPIPVSIELLGLVSWILLLEFLWSRVRRRAEPSRATEQAYGHGLGM